MEIKHEIIEAFKAYWSGSTSDEPIKRLRACVAYSAVQYPSPHPERPSIKDFIYCAVNLQELHCSDHASFCSIQSDIKTLIHFIALAED